LTVPYLGGKKPQRDQGCLAILQEGRCFKPPAIARAHPDGGINRPQSKPGAVSQQGSRTIRPAGHPERARSLSRLADTQHSRGSWLAQMLAHASPKMLVPVARANRCLRSQVRHAAVVLAAARNNARGPRSRSMVQDRILDLTAPVQPRTRGTAGGGGGGGG